MGIKVPKSDREKCHAEDERHDAHSAHERMAFRGREEDESEEESDNESTKVCAGVDKWSKGEEAEHEQEERSLDHLDFLGLGVECFPDEDDVREVRADQSEDRTTRANADSVGLDQAAHEGSGEARYEVYDEELNSAPLALKKNTKP